MKLFNRLKECEIIIIYGCGDYGHVFYNWMKVNLNIDEKQIIWAVSNTDNTTDYTSILDAVLYAKKSHKDYLTIVAAFNNKDMIKTINNLDDNQPFVLTSNIYEFIKNDKDKIRISQDALSISKEILWQNNLNRIINECDWIKQRDFTTGVSYAVDSHYLYTLTKILSMSDKKIFWTLD